jgi:pimeloyl-ACP methyl ester carboxylesterase
MRLGSLVLIDSLGIKIGARDERDIVDMHAIGDGELLDLLYADKARGPEYASLSDAELLMIAKNNEAFALFGWRPYMHNPKLRGRLKRISVPTLVVWGEEDRIVSPAYGRAFSTAIPQARFETVPRAGHFPFVEQPDEFVKAVTGFLRHARN